MGTNPLDALDLVRQRRGMDPVDSFTLGPARNEDPLSEEERREQDLVARMAEDDPPSPLIPVVPAQVEAAPAPPIVSGRAPDFLVLIQGSESAGALKGVDVVLNEADVRAVKQIILKAFQREVIKLNKTSGRQKKVSTPGGAVPEAVVPIKRGRGRPKGSLNKKKAVNEPVDPNEAA